MRLASVAEGGLRRWKVAVAQDPFAGHVTWSGHFTALTPSEFMTSLATTLAQLWTADALKYDYDHDMDDVYEPLTTAGWRRTSERFADLAVMSSPVGDARINWKHSLTLGQGTYLGNDETWTFAAGVPGGDRWYGHLSRVTPVPILAALTTAMATSEPVERRSSSLTHAARQAARITVIPAPGHHLTAGSDPDRPAGARTERAHAARGRSTSLPVSAATPSQCRLERTMPSPHSPSPPCPAP